MSLRRAGDKHQRINVRKECELLRVVEWPMELHLHRRTLGYAEAAVTCRLVAPLTHDMEMDASARLVGEEWQCCDHVFDPLRALEVPKVQKPHRSVRGAF